MRQYRFNLERILSIRKHRELEWELKLAAATGKCIALQNDLAGIDAERRRTLFTRFELAQGNVGLLAVSELYLRRLGNDQRKKQSQLAERERERDEIRAGYLTASKERKVLDKLKERREIEHHRKGLLEEVGVIDDMNASARSRPAE